WVFRADRLRGVEVRVERCGEWMLDGDELPVGLPEVAEITEPGARGGDRVHEDLATGLVEARIVHEEEGPVTSVVEPGDLQGPGQRCPVLVSPEVGLGDGSGPGEEVVGDRQRVTAVLDASAGGGDVRR